MSILISVAVFIAVYFVSAKPLETFFATKYTDYLLSNPSSYNSLLPARLSLAALPRNRIFTNLALPIPGKDGEEIQLGTVIVSRSGIFIICLLNGAGILDNSTAQKWKRLDGGRVTEFDNPFIFQKDARTLLEYYVQAANISPVKAHTIVLYTNDSLRFTQHKSRGVIFAGDYHRKLSSFEKNGRLSSAQIKNICSALKSADIY